MNRVPIVSTSQLTWSKYSCDSVGGLVQEAHSTLPRQERNKKGVDNTNDLFESHPAATGRSDNTIPLATNKISSWRTAVVVAPVFSASAQRRSL